METDIDLYREYIKHVSTRSYGQLYPEPNQLVIGIPIEQLGDINGSGLRGFNVQLSNFNDIKAFLPSSNISKKKKISGIRNIIRIGQLMTFRVIDVDTSKDNAYISLDLARVDNSDRENMASKESIINMLMAIGIDIARLWCLSNRKSLTTESTEMILLDTIWTLYSVDHETINQSLFHTVLDDPSQLFHNSSLIGKEFQEKYLKLFPSLLSYSDTKLNLPIMIYTILPGGMGMVSKILKTIQEETKSLEVQILSPPNYICNLVSPTIKEGQECFNTITRRIREMIKEIDPRKDVFVFESAEPIVVEPSVKKYRRLRISDLAMFMRNI